MLFLCTHIINCKKLPTNWHFLSEKGRQAQHICFRVKSKSFTHIFTYWELNFSPTAEQSCCFFYALETLLDGKLWYCFPSRLIDRVQVHLDILLCQRPTSSPAWLTPHLQSHRTHPSAGVAIVNRQTTT